MVMPDNTAVASMLVLPYLRLIKALAVQQAEEM